MNKSTKIAAGLALSAVGLLVAVAPASAQTPGTATGLLQHGNFISNEWVAGAQPTFSATGAAVITMPAAGSTGPISSGSLCLDYAAAGEKVIAVPCDGSDTQLFAATRSSNGLAVALDAVNRPTTSSRLTLGASATTGWLILRDQADVSPNWNTSAFVSHTPVSITGATAGATPTFSGTGQPGLTVEVRTAEGTVLATAVVGANGTWSATSSVDLSSQSYTVTAVQNDGTDASTDDLTFTVVGAPIADPLLAGGAGMVLVIGAAAVLAAKRRRMSRVTS